MKLQKLLLIAFLSLPVQAGAATITVGPGDCSAAAVNAAIASASDGDTVLLTCTGSVTWSSMVSIPNTKGITLAVQGGTNTPKGSANFPLTVVSSISGSPTIKITAGTNKALSRLTGFKFQNPGRTAGDKGLLWVSGCGQGKTGLGSFRIDNNYFDTISGRAIVGIYSTCSKLYGLFDNNTMHDAYRADDPEYGPYGIQVWNDFKDVNGCWGANGWIDPFAFGDANWVFIEDNRFQNITSGYMMRHYLSAESGGRYVARHNEFIVNARSPGGDRTDLIEGHGLCLCASNGCGVRGAEIYSNTFSGTEMQRIVMPRGGSWLVYDNVINDRWNNYSSPFWLMEYRAGSSGMYGQCSTSCPCTSPWYRSVTNGAAYPLAQQVSGTYFWNNLYLGSNQAPRVDSGGVQSLYIQEERDYFVSINKPAALSSYTGYTYPHPLRNASSSAPPSAPQNVLAQ